MNLTIDQQFKSVIPPLTNEEFDRLKENILSEGIRDRLVIWGNILIDGHNRYKIAQENNLPFETVSKEFESREHALNWIISNQLGRRNLTEQQIMYLRGKRYENEKKIHGGQGGNQYKKVQIHQNEETAQFMSTSQQLGKEYGVSEAMIQRDGNFAKGLDLLPPETKEQILTGETIVTKEVIMTLAKMEPTEQVKAIEEVKKGTEIQTAIKTTDKKSIRKENDKRIKRETEIFKSNKAKTKMSGYTISHHDITICSKDEFINNQQNINENAEVWIFTDNEKAHLAIIELRKSNLNLKIN